MLVRLLLSSALAAAAPHAGVQIRVPSVVTGGSVVAVRGSARGPVVLQRRVRRGRWAPAARGRRRAVARAGRVAVPGGRWAPAARGRWVAVARGRFPLRWRAPRARTVVRVRVVAPGIGHSRAHRVAVTPTTTLRAGRIVAAPPAGSAGTLLLGGRARPRVGEFVAAGVGPATPMGLLARVVGVRGRAVAVVPASLPDAVPAGRVDLGEALVRKARAPQRRDFRSAFSCTGEVGAELDGSLAVRLVPRFSLDWARREVRSALAQVTVSGDARLAARVGGAASCALAETLVAGWDAPPLRASVGPVPVVVVPRVRLYVSGSAEASAGAEASVGGHVSATAGLRWDGAAAHPIGSFSHRLTWEEPSVGARAALGARVIPSVEFLLYGQAGPRFDLSTGLQLDADPGATPWWKLAAPVELSAGLAVPSFPGLVIPQRTVLLRSYPLAQAPRGADPTAPTGSGPPGSGPPGSERARIAWDTAATDVDLHVWDAAGHHAWFRDPTAIPDGTLSDDDRHGFGPELFHDASGASAASPSASVTSTTAEPAAAHACRFA